MSSYNLSQSLNHINENNYDDDITATVPPKHFIAVTGNRLDAEGTQRILTVQMMTLEAAPGGESHTNSGLYIRGANETSVKAVLIDVAGKEVDSNVTNYS